RARCSRVAHPLPRPDLPRGARAVREHPAIPRAAARAPQGARNLATPRGGDVYLGCAPRRVSRRADRRRDRARAPLGAGAAAMKLATALRLGRVSNLPTVTSNVVAATALAGGHPSRITLLATCAAMSLMYVAGMWLNDAFDRDIDRVERP